jgi:hypothetical protein
MYEVISYHVETEREYESLLDIVEYMVANVQWSPELKVAAIS